MPSNPNITQRHGGALSSGNSTMMKFQGVKKNKKVAKGRAEGKRTDGFGKVGRAGGSGLSSSVRWFVCSSGPNLSTAPTVED